MIRKMIAAIGMAVAALVLATPACAQTDDTQWFLHVGITRLKLDDKISLTAAGNPVPNPGVHTKGHYTATVTIGHRIGRDFAAALIVGIPPHISVYGRKSLAPLGKLGELTYGPTMLTLQYRPIHSGPIQPYVGAGVSYMIVFSTKDAAFQHLKVHNDLAPALEAGTDIMLGKRWGLFVGVERAFLKTTATGTFGPAPVVAHAKLGPWALSGGVTIRF